MRIAIAEAGLDPTIGYLHVCQPGRQALVYDLMEPYRPQVDREVLAFVRSQTFTPRDFVIDARGMCRLHPELARQIAIIAQDGHVAADCVSSAAGLLTRTDDNCSSTGVSSSPAMDQRGESK